MTAADGVKNALAPYHCICSLDLTVKSKVTQLSKVSAFMHAVVDQATLQKMLIPREASDNFPNKKHRMCWTEPFLNTYRVGTMRAQVLHKTACVETSPVPPCYNLKQECEKTEFVTHLMHVFLC